MRTHAVRCRFRERAGYWEQQLPTLFGGEEVPNDVREAFRFADMTNFKPPAPEDTEQAKERLRVYVRAKELSPVTPVAREGPV
jgi:hypothetical protein